MSGRIDTVSLAAGLALAALGALLLLDQEEVINLSLGVVGAAIAAVIGIVLIASGLGKGGDGP